MTRSILPVRSGDRVGLRCARRHAGQSGYMLIAVIAMLGVITVLLGVLVTMTGAALRVSDKFADSSTVIGVADSALESTISSMRRDLSGAATECRGATDQGAGHTQAYRRTVTVVTGEDYEVIVDCETDGPLTDERDVLLHAYVQGVGSSGPDGAARAVIVDRVGGVDRPGVALRICDWQLGQTVTSSTASPTLASC